MNDEQLRRQINALIRDEIQEVINDYVDVQEQTTSKEEQTGLGFVPKEKEKDFTVNISNDEVDKIMKKYKKLKKQEKSNLSQVKKLGLVDKNGRPLKGP